MNQHAKSCSFAHFMVKVITKALRFLTEPFFMWKDSVTMTSQAVLPSCVHCIACSVSSHMLYYVSRQLDKGENTW